MANLKDIVATLAILSAGTLTLTGCKKTPEGGETTNPDAVNAGDSAGETETPAEGDSAGEGEASCSGGEGEASCSGGETPAEGEGEAAAEGEASCSGAA
jgi:hypothetical protein